ncbi:type II toxin-antitoxin system RelE/ParE family toxin [Phyllobacterium sp. 0TCS1.6C]|uniref:type II toxin-antitoxin system RelE/ParE family toxin n=1 Tax=unclassified Phyllobacterium TaxID=2638441 RepID=UPI002264B56B|nr:MULTISPECIES: type II toxin-antitoxin system RelE/ParE family toxin [unclassified Phyllobacterium]MCX8281979.1 type II toxin-antitoxin system RelE/ParE family toxin [Phyllobacterium sp. 0TCS1.6C]MCX8294442.1 type II toxin-antitoxin system RelE/ParE family toxin [Phyllobacterium sp. 0TCS1.6A]
MLEVRQTEAFSIWFAKLKDLNARSRILTRLRRLELGNPGDAKAVGNGIRELRVNCGPGYRVYYVNRGNTIVILLCGGDKSTQVEDIKSAKALAADL